MYHPPMLEREYFGSELKVGVVVDECEQMASGKYGDQELRDRHFRLSTPPPQPAFHEKSRVG